MSKIRVYVKPTQGDVKYTVEAEPTWTVTELKEGVCKESSIAAEDQRLIYKGKVLKDDDILKELGLDDEHVVHLVKRKTNAANAPSATPTPAPTSPAQGASESAAQTLPGLGTALGGMGGFPPMGMGLNEQSAASLMNSPMMQQLVDNPELLRTLLQSNPTIRQLLDTNPDMAQILNNPQLIRESLQVASNPALQREQMRNQDRAMSNIEAHPEGFNALRRMYENFQEPLMSAATGESNPFAALLQGAAGQGGTAGNGAPASSATATPAGGTPNNQPLPNPWASNALAGSGGGGRNMFGTVPNFGSLGSLGLMQGLNAGGSAGQAPDMNAMVELLQNPQMNEMMQQLMSQPGVVEQAMAQNPQMRQLFEGDPRLRETFNDPTMIRRILNPENFRAMVQLQQAMQHFSSAGLAPGSAGAGLGDFGLGGLGPLPPAPPVANPQDFYSSQLQQLQDMGFMDQQANILALQINHGDVSAAVAYLIERGAH